MKKLFEIVVISSIVLFFLTVIVRANDDKPWYFVGQVQDIETGNEIVFVEQFATKVACEKHAQKIRVFNRNAYFHYSCER